MKTGTVFPRRLFRWFLTNQIMVAAVALVALDFAILLWLENRQSISDEALRVGRETLLVTLLSAAVVLVGVSLFMARRLVIPLGRLIVKTQRIHRYPFDEDANESKELAYDEPGEWYDLERALNELARDLQQKTIRLSREKTELRAIMSSINEAVLAVNLDRRPLFYNTQFAESFGVESERAPELAVGEIVRSPDVLSAFNECLRDGTASQRQVKLEVQSLGQRVFRFSVAPLRKKHNQEIYGAVAIFYDVTEMKRAEDMRIEFVGNVSHELRTPLTSIKGYLQTSIADLERGDVSETLGFLKVVGRNVDRLMHLVDDLLDLSVLQTGVELKRSLIDLEEMTKSVLGQVDVREHQMGIEFEIKELYGDERRVEQVLRNLLQNAARYVPRGGKIDISWRKAAKGAVVLSVRDNGPGIAKELQPRLFERFFRVDEARSRQVGGSGIGLAIVKHIMQRHGGSVKVESEPGKGAEFICEFPPAHLAVPSDIR